MRFLSIRQPWAAAVVLGYKTIENRPWGATYRGPVAIHASQSADDLNVETFDVISDRLDDEVNWHHMTRMMLRRGHIIGLVDLVDVVRDSKSPWFSGPFGLVLSNARWLMRPIPWSGQLGLVVAQPALRRLLDQSETKTF
jgi:hypothetical protein